MKITYICIILIRANNFLRKGNSIFIYANDKIDLPKIISYALIGTAEIISA